MLYQNVTLKFTPKNTNTNSNTRIEIPNREKKIEIIRISPSISLRTSKETLKKSKFFEKKGKKVAETNSNKDSQFYAQATFLYIREILKIKENFPNLSLKKVKKVYKMINNPSKPKIR